MRTMGELAGVPIEPPEQTNILNSSAILPGVVGGGVPGAGGYDALWLLVLDDGSGLSLQHALSHWSALETAHVTPLLSSISPHGVLLTEDVHTVPGLAKLLEGCSM